MGTKNNDEPNPPTVPKISDNKASKMNKYKCCNGYSVKFFKAMKIGGKKRLNFAI